MSFKLKRILILAYTRQNLGDDLFLYTLLKEYPNVQFYINIEKEEHTKILKSFNNITIYKDIGRKLTKENATEYDGYIYIGGSIFMEGIGKNYTITEELLAFMKECNKNKIPFHYVSSNFGPYNTQEYLNLSREVFKNCTSIHFRDKYSANLFSDILTVHYAPDLLFSYIPEETKRKTNSVGISVIDLSIRPKLIEYKEKYYNLIINNIKNYIKQGKTITLFAFCNYEGDGKAINDILNKLSQDLKEKVDVVTYEGDITRFLREYSKIEYMICTRFHAMILSSIMNQKCKILSYSNKIDNVINDLNLFKNNVIHFNEIEDDTEIELSTFEMVDESQIKNIKKESRLQLSGVEESLKK